MFVHEKQGWRYISTQTDRFGILNFIFSVFSIFMHKISMPMSLILKQAVNRDGPRYHMAMCNICSEPFIPCGRY